MTDRRHSDLIELYEIVVKFYKDMGNVRNLDELKDTALKYAQHLHSIIRTTPNPDYHLDRISLNTFFQFAKYLQELHNGLKKKWFNLGKRRPSFEEVVLHETKVHYHELESAFEWDLHTPRLKNKLANAIFQFWTEIFEGFKKASQTQNLGEFLFAFSVSHEKLETHAKVLRIELIHRPETLDGQPHS